MKGVIFTYRNKGTVKIDTTKTNTCIYDSYRFKTPYEMKGILLATRSMVPEDMAIYWRSIEGMIREWRVHNLLYSLGIQRARTKDVDLNLDVPWYMKIVYTILSPFYLHFS